MKFRKLGISESILKVIKEEKFEEPSEIQEKCIPLVLAGKDVIAGSATGSGKTLVFGSVIIQNSEKGKRIQALILTPTRELAEQVTMALRKFSKEKPLDIIAVYGGVSINPQIDALRRADVVVGTPGRVLDHIQRKTIGLGNVKILVLDEADRMLDMGFIDDVERIISQCSKQRQTLLFSATIPPDLANLAQKYMKNPVEVSAQSYVDPQKLKQSYYDIDDNLKFSLLVHLLKQEHSGLIMVFCNTQQNTDFVTRNLRYNGIDAIGIHGGLSQAKRSWTMEEFHKNKASVLVCTDVASRGLDIKGVTHIYNYDIPKDSKQYIHRIGRTARAGKEGKAVNILSKRDHDNFSRLLNAYNVDITKEERPYLERAKIKESGMQRGFGHRRFGVQRQGEDGGRFRGNQRFGSHQPRRFGRSRSSQ